MLWVFGNVLVIVFIYLTIVYCQLCIEKTKIKKKEAGDGPFFKKKQCCQLFYEIFVKKKEISIYLLYKNFVNRRFVYIILGQERKKLFQAFVLLDIQQLTQI